MAVPPGTLPAGEALVKNRRVALVWNVADSDGQDHEKLLFPASVRYVAKRTKKATLQYSDGETQVHDSTEFAQGTFLVLPTDSLCAAGCREHVDLSSRFSFGRPSPAVCCRCTSAFHFDCARTFGILSHSSLHVVRPANIDEATRWVCPICIASKDEANCAPPRVFADPTDPCFVLVHECPCQFAEDVCAYVAGAVHSAPRRELRVPSERLSLLNILRKRCVEGRQLGRLPRSHDDKPWLANVSGDSRSCSECAPFSTDRAPSDLLQQPQVVDQSIFSPNEGSVARQDEELVACGTLEPSAQRGTHNLLTVTPNESVAVPASSAPLHAPDPPPHDSPMSPSLAPALPNDLPPQMSLNTVPVLGWQDLAAGSGKLPVCDNPAPQRTEPEPTRAASDVDVSAVLCPASDAASNPEPILQESSSSKMLRSVSDRRSSVLQNKACLVGGSSGQPLACMEGPCHEPCAEDGTGSSAGKNGGQGLFPSRQKLASLRNPPQRSDAARGSRQHPARPFPGTARVSNRLQSKRSSKEMNGACSGEPKKRPRISPQMGPSARIAFDLDACVFCRRKGSIPMCEGDLIRGLSYEGRKGAGAKITVKFSAHRNCLLWAVGPQEETCVVKGDEQKRWSNFEDAVVRSQKVGKGKTSKWADRAGVCHVCHEGGASLLCMFHGTMCSKPMHFRCALESGAGLFVDEAGRRITFCAAHRLGPLDKEEKPFVEEDLHFQSPHSFEISGTDSDGSRCVCCRESAFKFERGCALRCASCSKCFHAKCLLPNAASRVIGTFAVESERNNFRCGDCPAFCQICSLEIDGDASRRPLSGCAALAVNMIGPKKKDDEPLRAVDMSQGTFLKCCGCGLNAVHLACYVQTFDPPGLQTQPRDMKPIQFRCSFCRTCRHCGLPRVGIGSWSESLSACQECAQLYAGGNYCPVCNKAYPEDESDMICCDECDKWVHADCSDLSVGDFASAGNNDNIRFVCSKCCVHETKKKTFPRRALSEGGDGDGIVEVEEYVEASGNLLSGDLSIEGPQAVLDVPDEVREGEGADSIVTDFALEAKSDVELYWPPRNISGEKSPGSGDMCPTVDLCSRCGSCGDRNMLRFCWDCGDALHGFCCHVPLPRRLSIHEVMKTSISPGTRRRLTAGGTEAGAPLWRCHCCAKCIACFGGRDSDLYTCRHCGCYVHKNCVPEEFRLPSEVDDVQRTLLCQDCQICDGCQQHGLPVFTIHERHFCGACLESANCSLAYKLSTSLLTHPAGNGLDPILSGTCNGGRVSQSVSTEGTGENGKDRIPMKRNMKPSVVSSNAAIVCEKDHAVVFEAHCGPNPSPKSDLISGSIVRNSVTDIVESDDRVCLLCKRGEDSVSLLGRLIPWSAETVDYRKTPVWWVHALCAIWTSGVQLVFPDPSFESCEANGVDRAFPPFVWNTCFILANRGQMNALRVDVCHHCGKPGATVRCAQQDCNVKFHYACALEANGRMQVRTDESDCGSKVAISLRSVKGLTMHCVTHACEGSDSSTVADDFVGGSVTLTPSRRLDTCVPLRFKSVPMQKDTRDGRMRLRVGGLVVSNFGELVPNSPLFVQEGALVPAGMEVVRRHWSLKNPGERCAYYLGISGSSRSGPTFTIRAGDDPLLRVSAPTMSEAWSHVSRALEVSRVSAPDFSEFSLITMSGSDAFGLSNCRASVSAVEALPLAALFKGRYAFSFVEPDPLKGLPFAVPETLTGESVLDPFSCARTQGFVPRNRNFKGAPSYVNEPSGHRYQNHVAMGLSGQSVGLDSDRSAQAPGCPNTLWKVSRNQKSRCGDAKMRHGEKARVGESCEDALRATSTHLFSQSFAMQYRAMDRSWRRRTVVLRSRIEGWGVFATEDIRSKEMIIEYMGEIIRPITSDQREAYYDSRGIGCYMFEVESGRIVDATLRGNRARFINHSCDPNCYSRTVKVENDRRAICIFASRDIKRGEELCYNYQFPLDDEDRVECACRTKACTGFMN